MRKARLGRLTSSDTCARVAALCRDLSIPLIAIALVVTGCGLERPEPVGESLETILSSKSPTERTSQLIRYLDAASLADLPDISHAYQQSWVHVDEVATVLLASWWAQRDPVGAYNGGPQVVRTSQVLWSGTVVRIWAQAAPEEALSAVASSYPRVASDRARALVLALVRGWFDSGQSPLPLLDFIRELPTGRPLKEPLDVLFERLVDVHGPETAIEIVEQQDSPGSIGFRKDAFQRLATVLTGTDPQIAIDWASRHVDLPEGEHLYQRIARRWSRDEPKASLDWIVGWPTGEKRKQSLVEAHRIYLVNDTEAAIDWLDAQPQEPVMLVLNRSSLNYLVKSGRALDALARVESMNEPKRRDAMMVAVLRDWIDRDRSEAERWISEKALSPELVARIHSPKAARAKRRPMLPPAPES